MFEVRPSPCHGRGLFTSVAVVAGAELECAPAVLLSRSEACRVVGTPVADYLVDFGSGRWALVFGLLSMANHSAVPNVEFVTGVDVSGGPVVWLVALVDVSAGSELLVDYGPGHRV